MDGMILLGVIAVSLILGMGSGYLIGRAGRGSEAAEKTPHSPSSPAYPPDALHIWHDPQRKQLVIWLGKREFRSPDDLSMRQRKVMVGLLTFLRKWLGLPDQPPAAAPPAARSRSPRPTPPPQAAAPPSPPQEASPIPLAEPAPAAHSEQSIVAQIDAILQEKLAASALKHRGIRLMESPKGGMTIWVGLESYATIDEVPDADVVAVIRAAVQEWERR